MGLSTMGNIIGIIIGVIFVIWAAIFAFGMLISCTDSYREMVIERMKKEEIEKIRKSFPKEIIISIKHEKSTEDDFNE